MPRVVLKHCNSYQAAEVARCVEAALVAALGDEARGLRGKRVLLKPNLAIARQPERAATTHPEVIGAAIDALRALGAECAVGDSPAGAARGIARVWEATGMAGVCQTRQVPLVNFEAGGWIERSVNGHPYRLAKALLDFDCVVNLPKLKTHVLTLLTAAVKNTFGCVPGFAKSRFHLFAPKPAAMSRTLVDVFSLVKPALSLVDAVEAMDGNGPSSGGVRTLGLVAASSDAVALDAVLARLLGIDPLKVPTTAEAYRRRLGEARLECISLEGDGLGTFGAGDFAIPSNWQFALIPDVLARLAARWFWVRPVVDGARCIGCGDCERACAAAAIALRGDRAAVDYGRCVSCLCCIEVCPAGAISARRSRLARLVT